MKTTTLIICGLIISAATTMSFILKPTKLTKFNVQYVVECSVCDITYRDEAGKAIMKYNVEGKWNYSYNGGPGHFAYVSAITEEDNIAASVKVIVDGQIKKVDSSESKVASAKAGRILYED